MCITVIIVIIVIVVVLVVVIVMVKLAKNHIVNYDEICKNNKRKNANILVCGKKQAYFKWKENVNIYMIIRKLDVFMKVIKRAVKILIKCQYWLYL